MAKLSGQTLGIVQNPVVKVARMGVQGRRLRRNRRHNFRVAMPDMRHVVIAIQIAPPVGIP
ncbi:hypothetical protein GALL_550700 [mine drainage metagenome]|uniref:Uncharacterized protein n=1 Tax=mine drainage metagenome TaxID=410659 RepID=A0A1J5P7F4_9ZZZZ